MLKAFYKLFDRLAFLKYACVTAQFFFFFTMYWPGLEINQGKKTIKRDRNAVDVLNVRVKNTIIKIIII